MGEEEEEGRSAGRRCQHAIAMGIGFGGRSAVHQAGFTALMQELRPSIASARCAHLDAIGCGDRSRPDRSWLMNMRAVIGH